jgi:hypothetical protein
MIIETTGPITVHCYKDGEIGAGHVAHVTISSPMPEFPGGYLACSITLRDVAAVRELARVLAAAADRMEGKSTAVVEENRLHSRIAEKLSRGLDSSIDVDAIVLGKRGNNGKPEGHR